MSHSFDQTFDVVTMVQVIANFALIVGATVKVHDIVNARGIVLIESWDMDSIYARLWGKLD